MTIIKASVGEGGANQVADVRVVQGLLNRHAARLGLPPLKIDGSCGPLTITAVRRFQKMAGMSAPDGRIDPGGRTLAVLFPTKPKTPERLCTEALNGRPLTSGETRMLQAIFSNHIRYADVRIFSRSYSAFLTKTRAMAPDDNIYYPPLATKPTFRPGASF